VGFDLAISMLHTKLTRDLLAWITEEHISVQNEV